MRIVAVITWFNPRDKFRENVASCAGFFNKTYVVDNSEKNNRALLKGVPNIEYVANCKNLGLAKALNIGCHMALKEAPEWIVFFDQDSFFDAQNVDRFLEHANTYLKEPQVAAIGPTFERLEGNENHRSVRALITSGLLVKPIAFARIGMFNELLFVDGVDLDFCYRLKRSGQTLILLNDVFLNHQRGNPVFKKIGNRKIITYNHNYIRKYHITKSNLYLRKTFPEIQVPYIKNIFLDIAKILIVEEDKLRKLIYVAKGIGDYFRGNMGGLHE